MLLVFAVVFVLLGIKYLNTEPDKNSSTQSLAAYLSAPETGEFAEVLPGHRPEFPQDHGAHPEYRQEWWYFVGNLVDASGNHYGFQLTFFRFAGEEISIHQGDSAWHSRQSWMAHFAITDVTNNRFVAGEDISRQSLDLAGASAAPFKVWLNNWSVIESPSSCDHCFNLVLNATYGDNAIALKLTTVSQPVLQGDNGYSVKDTRGEVASYYYSIPDFNVTGTLTLDNQNIDVSGNSWMDREWSSAILGEEQAGWDWFALHLQDGSKLMLFQVRGKTPNLTPYRHGIYIDPSGFKRSLKNEQIDLKVNRTWKSNRTDIVYPSTWRVKINSPETRADLEIWSAIDDQELDLFFTYYEGAALTKGTINAETVTGEGYMEMTGYE